MKNRKLRIAWSAAWGVVCLLLIALWVRSYWISDHVNGYLGEQGVELNSEIGVFFVYTTGPVFPGEENSPKFKWTSEIAPLVLRDARVWFWEIKPSSRLILVGSPHWFPALLAALASTLLWFPWRFSLRTLLIGMTVATIGLGLAAYVIRS